MTDNIESIDTPELLPETRNAKWNNTEHTSFDIEINHPEFGWIPYGVKDGDSPDTYCYKLWAARDTLTIQEYEPPEVDLIPLKEEKHLELRVQRDRLRQIEFAVYNNANYQIRQEDQDNMNTFLTNAIGMLSGIMPRENFSIMDAGNILRTLSPEQIIELGLAMKAKVEEIYARYWYARDVLLANATTKAEIDAIQIPATLDA